MPTNQDDADAMFDPPATPLPPLPMQGFPMAAPSVESRREHRVKVSWPARVQLPDGRVIEVRVRDLSEGGVGLQTEVNIPAHTVLNFAMGVPGLEVPAKITPVTGTIRTTYLVLSGPDLCCGGMWEALPEASRELLGTWIRRLRK